MKKRLAKFIADTGFASRREAERLIDSGAVSVDGKTVDTPVFFVDGDEDIKINGKLIGYKTDVLLYAFHKPVDVITSNMDPQGRKTIYDCLPVKYKNLKYVGRLDYKTTGLLLLTNDGELSRKLTLPSSGIKRTYIAKLYPKKISDIKSGVIVRALKSFLSPTFPDESLLDMARTGITIDNVKYAPIDIDVISRYPLTVQLGLSEGKKNEIRIIMDHLGLPVKKLHRISYGNIKLGNLQVGQIIQLSKKDIDELIKSL